MIASFPRVETTVSLTLPLWRKKTASAGSPWEKTTCLFRYSRIVFPLPIFVTKAAGSKASAAPRPHDRRILRAAGPESRSRPRLLPFREVGEMPPR